MGTSFKWRYVSSFIFPLDIANVEEEFELPLNDDGNHILPEILKKYQFSRPR